jgi:hypothetical protein
MGQSLPESARATHAPYPETPATPNHHGPPPNSHKEGWRSEAQPSRAKPGTKFPVRAGHAPVRE